MTDLYEVTILNYMNAVLMPDGTWRLSWRSTLVNPQDEVNMNALVRASDPLARWF